MGGQLAFLQPRQQKERWEQRDKVLLYVELGAGARRALDCPLPVVGTTPPAPLTLTHHG
jgi:hypothetical protein